MATIIAKTKKFINDAHAEIEKVIPTELIVQEDKLYLGHDGEVLAGQEGQPLLQGPKGDKGDTGATGPQGPQGATGPQGSKGDTGATPNITATASVNNAVGTPAVSVVKGGTAEAPTFAFNFTNLKGQTGAQGPAGADGAQGPQGPAGADGAQGPQGPKGDTGATPNITATASVDANTGTPSVEVVKGGTAEAPTFAFNFKNLKGAKGDKGDAGAGGGVELYCFSGTFNIHGTGVDGQIYITFLNDDLDLYQEGDNSISSATSFEIFVSHLIKGKLQIATGSIIDTRSGEQITTICAIGYSPRGFDILAKNSQGISVRYNQQQDALNTVSGTFVATKILGTTATLATITADDETGDITITTPTND